MKIHHLVLVCFLLLWSHLTVYAMEPGVGESSVTLNVSGDPLADVLKTLSSQYGYTFIVDPRVKLYTQGVQVAVPPTTSTSAMAILAAAFGACAHVDGKIVRLSPCEQ